MPFSVRKLAKGEDYLDHVKHVAGLALDRLSSEEAKKSATKMKTYFEDARAAKSTSVYGCFPYGATGAHPVGLIGVVEAGAARVILCVLSGAKGAGAALVTHVIEETPSNNKISLKADTEGLVEYYQRFGFSPISSGSLDMECDGGASGSRCVVC